MSSTLAPARNPLFSEPIQGAVQVETVTWDGRTFQIGARVSFRVTRFLQKPIKGRFERDERVDGTIEELWVEQWRGEELAYAEAILDDGTAARAWFHRDRVGDPGFTGAVLDGALW